MENDIKVALNKENFSVYEDDKLIYEYKLENENGEIYVNSYDGKRKIGKLKVEKYNNRGKYEIIMESSKTSKTMKFICDEKGNLILKERKYLSKEHRNVENEYINYSSKIEVHTVGNKDEKMAILKDNQDFKTFEQKDEAYIKTYDSKANDEMTAFEVMKKIYYMGKLKYVEDNIKKINFNWNNFYKYICTTIKHNEFDEKIKEMRQSLGKLPIPYMIENEFPFKKMKPKERYSQEEVDQILQSTRLELLIAQYTPVFNKKGIADVGLCTSHIEKHPSLGIHKEKQYYNCFGCQASGNAITFIMDNEHVGFRTAAKYLDERAKYFGIDKKLKEPVTEQIYDDELEF